MTVKPVDEKAVFNTARKIVDTGARESYLRLACADDQNAMRQIRDLLRVHEEEQSFLESPPPGLDATQGLQPVTQEPGEMIGTYKLREQIGEGGFGVVYVAEQQEPVVRKVALKIIKPGMDSKEVIARFEAERQALALMDHPNVAKVLDAGTTESGRPYFVMELVKGVPITEFCDQQKLATEGRLELFADVCRAIQHAHQKGIIHRDLKPSNVMVTMHDDQPVAKVIDFGIAKALSTKLTEKTVYTSYGQMVGTPLYMSPEQAQLSGLDIDTRSDVYSLGVLLYELLTGTTPFDKETLNQAGYDEIRRIIREDEPPRPSIRISSLRDDALSNVSDRRKIDPRKLSGSLRGEMDWIVMKALEKDRNRRYESASALAADVGRLLNEEPVLACPPSWKYRAGKFLSKHRVATATSAVVALSLILGGLIAVGGWVGEANARQLAERERRNAEEAAEQEKIAKENERAARQAADNDARRARETLDLILAVLSKAGSNRRTGATYTVRAALDDLVKELPKKENIDAHSVIEIKHALAIAHVAAGKFSESITLLQEVEVATENDPEMKAECLRYLGYLQSDPKKLEQANLQEQRIGNSQRQSRALALLGMYQLESGDLDKAVETLSRARELFKPTGQLPMLAELPHAGYAIALSRKHDSGAEAAREEAERLALPVIGVGTIRWLDESHLWVSAGREDLGDFVLRAVLTHSRGLTDADAVRDLGSRYAREGKYDRGDNLFTESHKMLDSSGQYKEAVWRLIVTDRIAVVLFAELWLYRFWG